MTAAVMINEDHNAIKPVHAVREIAEHLAQGRIIPYLGPGMLQLCPNGNEFPVTAGSLAMQLTSKVSVPFKLRNNLTGGAQYIENFKHRKTLSSLMTDAFMGGVVPGPLHEFFAGMPQMPLIVSVWYDDAMQRALATRDDWGCVQGVSQAEHHGHWVQYFNHDNTPASGSDAMAWRTVLYQPLGSVTPAANFVVSDSDFVEVLTEIDIQTPIPGMVKQLRADRSFLFLGCRFRNQLERNYAKQVMKRSSARHWAVIDEPMTRNERRFLEEQKMELIDIPLVEFAELLMAPAEEAA